MYTDTDGGNIRDLPVEDQPRQKALSRGMSALTDTELIALLLSSGSRNVSALELARRIYAGVKCDLHLLAQSSIASLQEYRGVGVAKATTLTAALELGRRRMHLGRAQGRYIHGSEDAYQLIAPLVIDKQHEEVWLILMNQSGKVLHYLLVGSGGMTGAIVDPKIVMRYTLEHRATRIILVHNHPSGTARPSQADIRLTQKIKHASKLLDVQLTDHVIVANDKYFSFLDDGML